VLEEGISKSPMCPRLIILLIYSQSLSAEPSLNIFDTA
jgi:hypothetical protein